MIKPVKVEVPTTITLHIRQPQIIPYIKICEMRNWFEIEKLKKLASPYGWSPSNNSGTKGDFRKLKKWQSGFGNPNKKKNVLELHLPHQSWTEIKRNKAGLLANPEYNTTLYFVGGRKFNQVAGHPDGTELFVIEDVIYRRLTWRSITESHWDRKTKDAGIIWRTENEFVYFLYKCEKLNTEPTKSIIVDGIGLELLERDRPTAKAEEQWL